MDDSRRILDYSDLWAEASDGASKQVAGKSANGLNGTHKVKRQKVAGPSSTPLKSNGWSADGTPQTASSTRKVRRILTLLEAGNITQAEDEMGRMGAGKNNFEIQRALVLAKTGKSSKQMNGNGHVVASYDDDDDDDEDGAGDEEGYDDDMEIWEEDDEEAFVELDWQGGMSGSGRQLTHEEIWDDSALVDAWTAAEEEYKIFHSKRTEHEKAQLLREEQMKKRSALWYDSPAKGSLAAIAAEKAAKEEQNRLKTELEERKKQAKALLAEIAGPTPAIEKARSSNGTPKNPKRLKGTTPPSSSISGNLAWHSACATVSKTPNKIGAESMRLKENGIGPGPTKEASGRAHSAAEAHSDAARAAQGEEIFQNLAMAWYYAGYYQAMAMNWNAEQERSSQMQ